MHPEGQAEVLVAILEFNIAGYFVIHCCTKQLRRAFDVDDGIDAARLRFHRQRAALAKSIAGGTVALEQGRRTGAVGVC